MAACATWTGLPSANTDFGKWTLELTFQNAPGFSDVIGKDSAIIEVFFLPNEKNHPGPDQGVTPNWFYYWQQGVVPDLLQFTYDGDPYGSYTREWWIFGGTLRIGDVFASPSPNGYHYSSFGSLIINGIDFDTHAYGIDCVAEVVAHELEHKTNDLDGGEDIDNDGLPDYLEAALGCVVGNRDTHNVAKKRHHPPYSTYGDNEYASMVAARGKTGVAEHDWSKNGKNWDH